MRKLKFYKQLLVEIVETLCSICLYLDYDGRITHNKNAPFMFDHFRELKEFSSELRGVKNENTEP